MPYLILKENQKMFWQLPEPPAPFTIGRIADNNLAILDPQVSRQHAMLESTGDGVWKVSDMKSANGIFVNEEKTDEQQLEFGDEIRLGKTVLIFSDQQPQHDDDTE